MAEEKTQADELHLVQHGMLRAEIMQLADETRRLEVIVVGGVATAYSWLFSTNAGSDYPYLWCLPPFVIAVAAWRCVALYWRICEITPYLRSIEERFFASATAKDKRNQRANPALIGWERHRAATSGSPLLNTSIVFWAIMLCLSVAGAVHFMAHAPQAKDEKSMPVQVSGSLQMLPVAPPVAPAASKEIGKP